MGWKVVFAPQAHARLEEIVRFIAQDDSPAAIRFGDYLVDRAESLANFQNLERLIVSDRTCVGFCASHIFYYLCPSRGTNDRDYGFLALRASQFSVMSPVAWAAFHGESRLHPRQRRASELRAGAFASRKEVSNI